MTPARRQIADGLVLANLASFFVPQSERGEDRMSAGLSCLLRHNAISLNSAAAY
jgi:hypothetical protein